MYFKIEDKESKLYIDAMAYLKNREEVRKSNYKKAKTLIEELTNLKSEDYNLRISNNCFFQLARPVAIQIITDKAIPKGFKPKDKNDNIFPNLRTNKGRQLNELFCSLPNFQYYDIHKFFVCSNYGIDKFTLPYWGEFNGIIVVMIDSQFEPKATEYFIEITETEFDKLTKQ